LNILGKHQTHRKEKEKKKRECVREREWDHKIRRVQMSFLWTVHEEEATSKTRNAKRHHIKQGNENNKSLKGNE